MSDTFWFCFTFLNSNFFFCCCTNKGTVNCYLYVNCVIFVQREEKEDYAAEAQFVSEHGNVLARKVSQPCFHH